MIQRAMKLTVWLFGGLLGLVVALYLLAVAINWKDQSPSPAAIRFASLYGQRPVVPNQDNAYIYVMGFDAARTDDPFQIGLQRTVWLQRARQSGRLDTSDDPLNGVNDYRSARSAVVNELLEACTRGNPKCATALTESDDAVNDWLSTEAWLLERYQALLEFPGWLERVPFDASEPLPAYAAVMDGQRLLLVKSIVLAKKKDYTGARSLLEQDIRFWRMVQESSDILISKMIAAAALSRHFEIGNVALKQLPAVNAINAMPVEWQMPLSTNELSMLRCFVGEWMFSASMLRGTSIHDNVELALGYYEPKESVVGRVSSALAAPLFQLQGTINKSADHLAKTAEILSVPLDQFEAATARASALGDQLSQDAFPPKSIYNVVGTILMGINGGAYFPYAKRVADVEGARRAAVTAVMLRKNGVTTDQVAAALESTPLRNPFNGKSFEWDAETESVVFIGLVVGERGVHRFVY